VEVVRTNGFMTPEGTVVHARVALRA
jgi:hypothetical protein